MESLIAVFRMNELFVETRIKIIIELGLAINNKFQADVTNDLVYELVIALDPDNDIKNKDYYKRRYSGQGKT